MEQKKSLNYFISEQLHVCGLEETPQNKKKFRVKFTQLLKDEGIWDKAEEKVIDRKKTKVFTKEDFWKLERAASQYLAKQQGFDTKELKKKKEAYEKAEREFFEAGGYTYENHEEDQDHSYRLNKYEVHSVMIKALFEVFFTPINEKLWEEDINTYDSAGSAMYWTEDDFAAIVALERLESYNKSAYYKRREEYKKD